MVGECLHSCVHLAACDVRVAADSREVSVPQVLSDKARVARGLPQPCCGRVPERVRRDVLGKAGTDGATVDDRGKHVRLQPSACKAAEDMLFGRCLAPS